MNTTATLHVTAELDNLSQIRRFIEETAASLTSDSDAVGDMVLATNEAVTNIIVHGYRRQNGMIEVAVEKQDGVLIVCLRDQAPLFDQTSVPTPDIAAPLHQRAIGGMGVHMMRHLTDDLHYQVTAAGENQLTLAKRLER